MLNRPPREFQSVDVEDWRQEQPPAGLDFDKLLGAARRRFWLVLLCCLAGGAMGVAYLLVAIPKYTAATEVMIDQRRLNSLEDQYALDAVGTQSGGLESEVELIQSERVAGRVVDALNLTTDAAFNTPGTSPLRELWRSVRAWVPQADWFESEPVTPETLQRSRDAAVATLRRNLAVNRLGLSYVLRIRYTDDNPQQAARIANAYAEAYLTDQMESAYDATRRASEWLQIRVQELQQTSEAADLAVQQFMIANDLVDTASDAVSQQQLTGVNSQLISARGATAEAEAKLQQVQAILDSGDMEAAVSETLQNSIITNLRSRYLEASKRRSELEPTLGASHLQVVNLKSDMLQYQRMMFDELGRIAESYKSEYAIAKAREEALEANLAAALNGSRGGEGNEISQLRELQRSAETTRNLYQTYQQRYQEINQQESFPITDARVLNVAAVPGAPSEPQWSSVLRTYLIFGALLGGALGAFAEYRDRVFRTGQQVRDELGLEFLGMMPLVGKAALKKPRRRKRRKGAAAGENATEERKIEALAPISRHVIDQPLSGFSETLRAAKVGVDLILGKKEGKIIGVTSVLPAEGKSTVAKNLASLLAHQGKRTLLIDGDLRNPGLSREVADTAEVGILDAVLDGRPIEELVLHEADTNLDILPAAVKRRSSHTSDVLASSAMRALLEGASRRYEYIVLDLPPMGPVVDVRAVAAHIDAFLYVVAWGSTPRKLVRDTLREAPGVYEKCVGVVLNKVDPNKLKAYESYGSSGYYYGRYSSYYQK